MAETPQSSQVIVIMNGCVVRVAILVGIGDGFHERAAQNSESSRRTVSNGRRTGGDRCFHRTSPQR